MRETIIELLRRGETDAALQQARVDAVTAPEDPVAQRLLALALHQAGDDAGARAAIERSISLVPDDPEAHFHLATLLLVDKQQDAAHVALERSLALDPNQFRAYLIQAQLALGRGDLDEAERQRKLAARVNSEHPQLAAIDGMLALRRGDGQLAQTILANAVERTPDEPQLLYALGFAYLQLGHHAFAEQAFRKVLELAPAAVNLHALIADLLRRQGLPAEAAVALEPLLADPEKASPGLLRLAGELELEANRPAAAITHLVQALAMHTDDQRTLQAALAAWRRLGRLDEARSALDAALATTRESAQLWAARLAVETPGTSAATEVIERWLTSMPRSVEAHELRMADYTLRGEADAAMVEATKLLELEPGRYSAELHVYQDLIARDPVAAVARCENLLSQAQGVQSRARIEAWLAQAHDRAGQPSQAVQLWQSLHDAQAAQRLAAWTPSSAREAWPDMGTIDAPAARVALLWGAPGSGVDRVAAALSRMLPAMRSDRFGPRPPRDPFQRFSTIGELQEGALTPGEVVSRWREALGGRQVADGQVIDWLPYWDNILLIALRPYLPEAVLLIALRDPRDMLLDWLAYGSPLPLALTSAGEGAQWMAAVMTQIADLHDADLYPHRLLRLDDSLDDAQALARQLCEALSARLPVPQGGLGPSRFPAGHWRVYREALGEAFALLAPVALRLGYPAD